MSGDIERQNYKQRVIARPELVERAFPPISETQVLGMEILKIGTVIGLLCGRRITRKEEYPGLRQVLDQGRLWTYPPIRGNLLIYQPISEVHPISQPIMYQVVLKA